MRLRDAAVPGCSYAHASGAIYNVRRLARDPDTGGTLVIYRDREGRLHSRPLWHWAGSVETERGRVPRFQRLTELVK